MDLGLPPSELRRLRASLLGWYDSHRRQLPWRETSDPYRIWVSEIMLQQTRVAAVLEHYRAFLQRFPTVKRLAQARQSAVLAAWSGLGYYRRARMLHQAARQVVRQSDGVLPSTAGGWRELPGIGRYTAAAIASIAHGEPVAVVDGNVERVLQRLLSVNGDAETWSAAEALLERRRPGDFNQAMMELGATVCLPGQPVCGDCPIARRCKSRLGAGPSTRPASLEQRRKRDIAYALDVRDRRVRLRQRNASETLMPGMWELPAAKLNGVPPAAVLRHSVTVTDYRVHVLKRRSSAGVWVPFARLERLPLTGLTRKILRRFEIIE